MKSFTFLLFYTFFFASQVLPVSAASFVVTPLALNFNVERRDIINEKLVLINNQDRQVRVYASVNEVSTNGEGVLESFIQPSMSDRTKSPTSWIQVTRSRIELKPGEKREVPITIKMNPNTEPGDYSVFVGFAEASNEPEAVTKVMAGDGVGTLINLTIDKKQEQFLRLDRFIVDRFVTGKTPATISYTITNPGRVDVVPKGEVIIYDTLGVEVASIPLNETNESVAGESTKGYTAVVPEGLGLGKYKAFLSVEYGEHLTASLNDTAFFYVLPFWQILLVFLLILLLTILLALYVYKRYDVIDTDGSEPVSMYRREGLSNELHHDINLKKPTQND